MHTPFEYFVKYLLSNELSLAEATYHQHPELITPALARRMVADAGRPFSYDDMVYHYVEALRQQDIEVATAAFTEHGAIVCQYLQRWLGRVQERIVENPPHPLADSFPEFTQPLLVAGSILHRC